MKGRIYSLSALESRRMIDLAWQRANSRSGKPKWVGVAEDAGKPARYQQNEPGHRGRTTASRTAAQATVAQGLSALAGKGGRPGSASPPPPKPDASPDAPPAPNAGPADAPEADPFDFESVASSLPKMTRAQLGDVKKQLELKYKGRPRHAEMVSQIRSKIEAMAGVSKAPDSGGATPPPAPAPAPIGAPQAAPGTPAPAADPSDTPDFPPAPAQQAAPAVPKAMPMLPVSKAPLPTGADGKLEPYAVRVQARREATTGLNEAFSKAEPIPAGEKPDMKWGTEMKANPTDDVRHVSHPDGNLYRVSGRADSPTVHGRIPHTPEVQAMTGAMMGHDPMPQQAAAPQQADPAKDEAAADWFNTPSKPTPVARANLPRPEPEPKPRPPKSRAKPAPTAPQLAAPEAPVAPAEEPTAAASPEDRRKKIADQVVREHTAGERKDTVEKNGETYWNRKASRAGAKAFVPDGAYEAAHKAISSGTTDLATLEQSLRKQFPGMTHGQYRATVSDLSRHGAVELQNESKFMDEYSDPRSAFAGPDGLPMTGVKAKGPLDLQKLDKSSATDDTEGLKRSIRDYAREWTDRTRGYAPMHAVMRAMREMHPDASHDQINDALTEMHTGGGARMSAFTQAAHEMPDPGSTHYISSRPMKYVHVPESYREDDEPQTASESEPDAGSNEPEPDFDFGKDRDDEPAATEPDYAPEPAATPKAAAAPQSPLAGAKDLPDAIRMAQESPEAHVDELLPMIRSNPQMQGQLAAEHRMRIDGPKDLERLALNVSLTPEKLQRMATEFASQGGHDIQTPATRKALAEDLKAMSPKNLSGLAKLVGSKFSTPQAIVNAMAKSAGRPGPVNPDADEPESTSPPPPDALARRPKAAPQSLAALNEPSAPATPTKPDGGSPAPEKTREWLQSQRDLADKTMEYNDDYDRHDNELVRQLPIHHRTQLEQSAIGHDIRPKAPRMPKKPFTPASADGRSRNPLSPEQAAGFRQEQADYKRAMKKHTGDSAAHEAEYGRAAHRAAVESALASGQTVPPEVLADYPDLAPKPAAEAPKPAAEAPKSAPAAADPERNAALRKIDRETRDLVMNNPMKYSEGVNIRDRNIPKDVAGQFDSHGTQSIHGLAELLSGGIDPSRELYSSPLSSAMGEGSQYGISVRDSSPFVVLGKPGVPLKTGGIHAVLVDDTYAPSIPKLQAMFPKVRFVPASESGKVLPQMAKAGGGAGGPVGYGGTSSPANAKSQTAPLPKAKRPPMSLSMLEHWRG